MILSIVQQYYIELAIIGIIQLIASAIIDNRQSSLLRIIGVALLLIATYFYGGNNERTQWEKRVIEAQQKIELLEAKSKEETIKTVIIYKDKIKYIDKVKEQKVTEFVTVKEDTECKINNGFIRFHNALVDLSIVNPTESDRELSDVKLQQLLDTIKINYTTAHKNAQQLTQLQDWIITQRRIRNE